MNASSHHATGENASASSICGPFFRPVRSGSTCHYSLERRLFGVRRAATRVSLTTVPFGRLGNCTIYVGLVGIKKQNFATGEEKA